jgi:hypothetical protein
MSWLQVIGKARSASRPLAVYALGLAVGLCLPASALIAADCVGPLAGAANPVTLRTSPAATSAVRGSLRPGESLPLVASLPGWYETRLDGVTVFAAKRSTTISTCPTAIATPGEAKYELHAIDVGTGLSVLVRGADFAVLYDAGSNDDLARGDDNRTIAYLKTLQPPLQKLDHILLSHPHRDHVELLPDVVTRFQPSEVWNSGAFNDICGYRNFLLAVAAIPSVKYHTATGDSDTQEDVDLGPKKCYQDAQPKQTVVLKHAPRITAGEKIPVRRRVRSFEFQ